MNIVSFSGGKDSTAMLLMMLEKGIPIDDIVFCDTGMEFPEMYNHISKVEKYIKRKVTVLKRAETYQYFLGEHKKEMVKWVMGIQISETDGVRNCLKKLHLCNI